ncbi:hypothetical protein TgHK011_002687 [Trichoderma gracile]|nr:hypothetical protein TgHK011_002687 [Trichoderma gracile]
MSSTSATAQGFTLPLDTDNHHDFAFDLEPRNSPAAQQRQVKQKHQLQQRSSIDSNLLSPFLSRVNSDSLSPANPSETPAGSTSTLSIYQSSDFSDFDDDPFFGANFTNPELSPSKSTMPTTTPIL